MRKIAYREGHKDMIQILNDNFESFNTVVEGTATDIAAFDTRIDAVEATVAAFHGMSFLQIADTPIQITGWGTSNGLYYYRIGVSQIQVNSYVEIIPFNADLAIVQAMQLLPQLVSGLQYFDFYAKNLPTAIFHITINIWTP